MAHKESGELEQLAGRIYATERRRLLAIARQNSDRPEDAEEALSEAFCQFIDKFDPKRFSEPVAWLTTTVKRECWQIGRRGKRERPEHEEGEIERQVRGGGDPAERVEAMARAREVRAAMERLKPQERRVIGLLAAGYSYREIMELTGWTYTKVNRCSAEGRARLRKLGLEIYKCHGRGA